MFKIRDLVNRRVLGTVDESFVLSLNSDGSEDAEDFQDIRNGRKDWQIVDADPEQNEVVAPVSQVGALRFGQGSCRQSLLKLPLKGQMRRRVLDLEHNQRGK